MSAPYIQHFEEMKRALGHGFERVDDFGVFGEAANFLLGEDTLAVCGHDKLTAAAGNQFRLDIQLLLQFGGQTGRLGQVVSPDAVFDGHVHDATLLTVNHPD